MSNQLSLVRRIDMQRQTSGAAIMVHSSGSPQDQIREIIEAWADGVRRHDFTDILANHARDIVMFDLPPPLQLQGIEEYKKTWDLFFQFHRPSQAFDIEELTITAGSDVAFAVAIMRCGTGAVSSGFLFRLTIGLRNINGIWSVTHEHHSLPATDQT
jgi:ketosteroid isomerase-like protein